MSFEVPSPTTDDAGWFHKLKKRFGTSKEETPAIAIGSRFKIVNNNTGQVMDATLTRIDPRTGQLVVEIDNCLIPQFFANSHALQEAIETARSKTNPQEEIKTGSDRVRAPVAVKPRFAHVAYTTPLPDERAPSEYMGRERITSRTSSVQGKVYLPDILENFMEGIVVDYEKDLLLKQYLENTMLPHLLHERILSGRKDFESTIECITKKIALDFPYQKKMLDDQYAITRYPLGQKVGLGLFMKNQDMICRHMGLLFAATIDYLKKYTAPVQTGLPTECDVRFMAEMQRDLLKGRRDGHAYCVMQNGEDYYVIDPTAASAKNIKTILASRSGGDEKYRYLFSALRFMLQNPNKQQKSFLREIREKTKGDPKLAGLMEDLRLTLRSDSAALAILKELELAER